MKEQKLRDERILSKLDLNKLTYKLKEGSFKDLGSEISSFIHLIFEMRKRSESLNWCFANIKRVKIFLLIFHANESGKEIYKEEIAKKINEYSYKTIAKIIDEGIKKNYFVLLNPDGVAGKDGNANASAYSSAKAGAIGLTKSLGKELADKNIAVNAVTPAGAKTRILDQMSKEHVARMLSKVPRGRFLEIEEFTSLICWLSSEENSFSTAAVFDISGGRSTY